MNARADTPRALIALLLGPALFALILAGPLEGLSASAHRLSAVSPIPPAIGVALGASLGFMLPVSTPPNAIVYGTGLPLREMIRAGFWRDLAGIIVIWVSLRALCPALGVM